MKTKLFTGALLATMVSASSSFAPKPEARKALNGKAAFAKKSAIRLYPNPSTNGRITVSSNMDQTLHFYVFDLDGTLLHQVILKDKQKQTIYNLKKGTYVYDAFLNDEGVEHGSIIVK